LASARRNVATGVSKQPVSGSPTGTRISGWITSLPPSYSPALCGNARWYGPVLFATPLRVLIGDRLINSPAEGPRGPLLLRILKQAAFLDEPCDLRWHHGLPARITRLQLREDLPRRDV
jgi:hypothetical protein